MFIEVRENIYVNLEHVRAIFLAEDGFNDNHKTYRWVFVHSVAPYDPEGVSNYLSVESQTFKSKDEAVKWFKENVEPALNTYWHAKIDAPIDTATFIEAISVIIEDIKEYLEKM